MVVHAHNSHHASSASSSSDSAHAVPFCGRFGVVVMAACAGIFCLTQWLDRAVRDVIPICEGRNAAELTEQKESVEIPTEAPVAKLYHPALTAEEAWEEFKASQNTRIASAKNSLQNIRKALNS